MARMIVIKFGGTSVGSEKALRQAIEIVGEAAPRKPIVVVSALSGITNQLVDATKVAAEGNTDAIRKHVDEIRERHEEIGFALIGQKEDFLASFLAQLHRHTDQITDILKGIALVGDVSLRAKDKITAIGEKLSSVLFSYTMRIQMLTGVHVDSEEVVVTDACFGEANPLMPETTEAARKKLVPEVEKGHIPVMGGFIGRALTGGTTTLGRGGSDYSAAIVGAAVSAEEIQIWTDVDGMMTCDPRVIPSARIIELISYVEAAELAYFGAKVLHPKTIWPAVDQRIPIRVLNTHNPQSRGTLITMEGDASAKGPRAIAIRRGITVLHITSNQMLGAHGFLAKVFDVFGRLETPVDLITTSEVSLSVTIDSDAHLTELVQALSTFADVRVLRDQAVLALVGKEMTANSRATATVFEALGGIPLTMLSLGSSDLNLSMVMNEKHVEESLRTIHRAVFESVGG